MTPGDGAYAAPYARAVRLPIMIASALLAVSSLACGGDDPKPAASASATSTPTPSPLTKEAWVAAINPICADVEKESQEIPEPTNAKEWVTGTQKYLDVLKDAQVQMRALVPPAADAKAVEDNFYRVNDAQITILETELLPKLQDAAAKNDKAAADAAAQEGFDKFAKAAEGTSDWSEQYGLSSCA